MKKKDEHPLKKWNKRPAQVVARIKAKADEKDLEHLTPLGKKEYYAAEVPTCKIVNTGRNHDD